MYFPSEREVNKEKTTPLSKILILSLLGSVCTSTDERLNGRDFWVRSVTVGVQFTL
jgi:hypothetical protein